MQPRAVATINAVSPSFKEKKTLEYLNSGFLAKLLVFFFNKDEI